MCIYLRGYNPRFFIARNRLWVYYVADVLHNCGAYIVQEDVDYYAKYYPGVMELAVVFM